MLAKSCQVAILDAETTCNQKASGFVMGPVDSATAIYQAGVVLCKGHGLALEDETQGTQFFTIAEIADMMTDEDIKAQKEASMEVLPNAPSNLVDLAAKFNSMNTESKAPESAPEPDAVPASESAPEPDGESAPTISAKAAQIATLRQEAAALHDEAQKLYTQADLIPAAASVLRDAARKLDKQSKAKEQEIARLLEPTVRYLIPKEMVELRQAIYLGGMEALRAFDAAVESGLLGKKAKTAPKASTEPRATTTGPKAASTQANEDRNRRVEAMLDQGYKAKYICNELGLSEGTVAGITHRYNLRKAHAA